MVLVVSQFRRSFESSGEDGGKGMGEEPLRGHAEDGGEGAPWPEAWQLGWVSERALEHLLGWGWSVAARGPRSK